MADYHLACQKCDFRSVEDQYYILCPLCTSMLEVILDNNLEERVVDNSQPSLFKYHNFMPYSPCAESLQFENYEDTPEFIDEKISELIGVEIIIKDEMVMPTHTWKDREGFVSINRLLINGIDNLMVFSSGNTGTSLARSASIVKGPRIHLVIPNASKKRLSQVQKYYDPKYVICHYFDGSNDECIVEARRIAEKHGYVVEGGFSNYARREGLKLLGLEHIWNSDFKIDWYAQPVAGGIGVYSFDKACRDSGKQTPHLLGVQAEICDPMIRAWRDNATELENRHIPKEVIPSDFVRVLRTRDPGNSYEVLKKIMDRCSGGFESVSDSQIYEGLRLFYKSEYFRNLYLREGVLVGLEPATVLAGVDKAVRTGMIKKDSKVLLNVSGADKTW